jgi:hypothetical protein
MRERLAEIVAELDARARAVEARRGPQGAPPPEPVAEQGPGQAPKGLATAEGGEYPFTVRGKPEFRTDTPLGEQAQNFVVRRGRLTKTEHLVALDANGNAISHLEGSEHRVGMSDDLKRALLDPNARVVVHHNHPDNTALSIQDWAQFAYPGLHAVWAHGHEGAVSRGELTSETRGAIARMSPEQAWHKIYSVAGRVDRQVHQLLSQMAKPSCQTLTPCPWTKRRTLRPSQNSCANISVQVFWSMVSIRSSPLTR